MKGKARENLEVALQALEAGYVDAAASRLYYAVFQAAVHALERQGRTSSEARPGARVWDHRIVGDRIALVRGRSEDGQLFQELRALRVQADYGEKCVERRRLERLRHEAARFVREATS